MKIYSWNMLYRNRELREALAFIRGSTADIFCLQEVPEDFLKDLSTLPYEIASRPDTEKEYAGSKTRMYHVILSRFPIRDVAYIPFPEYWDALPWRTRLFIALMPNHLFSKIYARGGVYADVEIGSGMLRVFSLHLILAQPAWRLREFELALTAYRKDRPTIFCGDFNTLEKPHITLLNWLLGSSVWDFISYRRERTTIERRFAEHSLTNPLLGHTTHPLSRSQLDHILVSPHFTIEEASVIRERYGSDHNPIRVSASLS